jgi:hypothetical protein
VLAALPRLAEHRLVGTWDLVNVMSFSVPLSENHFYIDDDLMIDFGVLDSHLASSRNTSQSKRR